MIVHTSAKVGYRRKLTTRKPCGEIHKAFLLSLAMVDRLEIGWFSGCLKIHIALSIRGER
jgi:hypothetical protein